VFWINNLGETSRGTGFPWVGEVKEKLKLKGDPTEKDWERYFDLEEKEKLTDDERKVTRAWKRVNKVTDSFFRVQGRIRESCSGVPVSELTLTTEFIGRNSRHEIWNEVYELGVKFDARVEWEYVHKENAHSYKVDPKTGKKIEGSDIYGPDHGRMIRQVGLVWSYPLATTLTELTCDRKQFQEAVVKARLDRYWVSVI